MIKIIEEDYLNEELLEEMASVYMNDDGGPGVSVHPDSNRIGGSYFKYHNKPTLKKSTEIIRIFLINLIILFITMVKNFGK